VIVLGVREEPLRQAAPFQLSQFVRSFWIDPREHPDFAWAFVTRGLVMLGFYSLLTFLQFFLRDTLHFTVPKAAAATAHLGVITIAAAALVALGAGWSSDRIGRKAIVSIAGGFLALTSVGLLSQPPYSTLMWIAALFGIGYGAYTSVDWALALDVLPSSRSAAKDLGVWGIANTLPQVLAPSIGGPLLDAFNHRSPGLGYTVIFSIAIVYVVLGSVLVWKIKGTR
jgi:MFS family permease